CVPHRNLAESTAIPRNDAMTFTLSTSERNPVKFRPLSSLGLVSIPQRWSLLKRPQLNGLPQAPKGLCTVTKIPVDDAEIVPGNAPGWVFTNGCQEFLFAQLRVSAVGNPNALVVQCFGSLSAHDRTPSLIGDLDSLAISRRFLPDLFSVNLPCVWCAFLGK